MTVDDLFDIDPAGRDAFLEGYASKRELAILASGFGTGKSVLDLYPEKIDALEIAEDRQRMMENIGRKLRPQLESDIHELDDEDE